MKKRILGAVMASVLAISLSGCGNSSSGSGNKTTAKAKETVSIEDAETDEKHIPTDAADTVSEELTDENIDSFVEIGEYRGLDIGASEDLEIEPGMTASITYKGMKDGAEFDGGSDKDFELLVGSNSFPEEFEKKLIGHKAGDKLKIIVTYPSDYEDDTLAGEKVVYVVKIEHVYRNTPDMVCMQFMDACTVKKYPESMLEELTADYVDVYRGDISGSESLSTDEILKEAGMSKDLVMDMVRSSAKQLLVCRAVFVREGVSRDDEAYKKILADILDEYGAATVDEAAGYGLSKSDIYEAADMKMLESIIVKYGK